MKKIKVIKQFVFNAPKDARPLNTYDLLSARETGAGVTARVFEVGVHEIDDETANHPWIAAGADGHIESVKQ